MKHSPKLTARAPENRHPKRRCHFAKPIDVQRRAVSFRECTTGWWLKKDVFLFTPTLGKIPILTIIFFKTSSLLHEVADNYLTLLVFFECCDCAIFQPFSCG